MQSLQLLTFVLIGEYREWNVNCCSIVYIAALMVSVTFAEIIQKGKLAKHGMLKENKPNCLLVSFFFKSLHEME